MAPSERQLDRRDWLELIGRIPDPPDRLDLSLQPAEDAGEHWRRPITYRSDAQTIVPAFLLLPKKPLPNRPALVCVHGYGNFAWGKSKVVGLSPALHDWTAQAAEAADAGFVVLCPDMHGFEQRRPSDLQRQQKPAYYDDASYLTQETLRMVLRGSSYQAHCLADVGRGVDVLASLDDVDPRHIGMFGQSFGGWETLFAMLVDERIAAGVCSCGVTLLADIAAQQRPFGLQALIPGLLARGDMDALPPLLAPRPLMLLFGSADPLTRPEPTARIVERARAGYAGAGAADRLAVHVHERGHSFHRPMREMALAWLKRWLSETTS